MFTGLIKSLGSVRHIESTQAGRDLNIFAPSLASDVAIGDSISVSGVCLTVVANDRDCLRFQAGPETLARTNLNELQVEDRVNLEPALRLCDRLGGHFVQGHVDGTGTIVERSVQADWAAMSIRTPGELLAQIVSKGSVAVDGISLTVVTVHSDRFSVALIPHTLENTTLGGKGVGATVNLETDILAKYVARYLGGMPLVKPAS